jgi:hypothetical protein
VRMCSSYCLMSFSWRSPARWKKPFRIPDGMVPNGVA